MKKDNQKFINLRTKKRCEKITIADAVASRDYYKRKLEFISKRYKKFKEHNAPEIILQNEKRIYNDAYKEFIVFDMALDFYIQGIEDKRNDMDNDTNICVKNLELIQTEVQAFNRAFIGSEYLKKKEEQK